MIYKVALRSTEEGFSVSVPGLPGCWSQGRTETLVRDWERVVTFYDFPREHWKQLRTTNPVESPFAAVRLRTDAGKRYKKVANATALTWRLLLVAEKTFRRLDHPELLPPGSAGRPLS